MFGTNLKVKMTHEHIVRQSSRISEVIVLISNQFLTGLSQEYFIFPKGQFFQIFAHCSPGGMIVTSLHLA